MEAPSEGTIFTADALNAFTSSAINNGRVKPVIEGDGGSADLDVDQKYLIVAIDDSATGTASVDLTGGSNATTYTAGDYIQVKTPVVTGISPSSSSAASGMAGLASDDTITITSAAGAGNVDLTVDGVSYTVEIGAPAAATEAATATALVTALNADATFSAAYDAAAVGAVVTITPVTHTIPETWM